MRLQAAHQATEWSVATSPHPLAGLILEVDGYRLRLTGPRGWRGSSIEVSAGEATGSDRVRDLVHDVLPLLRIACPGPLQVLAIWSADDRAGLVELDASARAMSSEIIAAEDRQAFLTAAGPRLSSLSGSERLVLSALIDMFLLACEPGLEPSVAISSSALELAADEWLPKSAKERSVDKDARAFIRDAYILAANLHAPESEFAANAEESSKHLFQRTARERFRALLEHLEIAPDEAGVANFVRTRNKVVHGGFHKLPLEARAEALFFGRWMLSTCLVRYLGYTGPVVDWRESRLI